MADGSRSFSNRRLAGGVTIGNVSGGIHEAIIAGRDVYLDAIDWQRVDFSAHFARLRQLFVDRIAQGVADVAEEEAQRGYVPLQLWDARTTESTQEEERGTARERAVSEMRTGSWDDLVQHPDVGLILGEAGSGKTTLLLHTAQALADRADDDKNALIPVYLPLGAFKGGDLKTVLDMAAYACGQAPEILEALWRKDEHRPLCLLLDGADEVAAPYVPDLAEALASLLKACSPNRHSLFVACRPGAVTDEIRSAVPAGWHELHLLPLNADQIAAFVTTYGSPELGSILAQEPGLRRVVQTPGFLAALARPTRGAPHVVVPRNVGQIYRLLIDHTLFGRSQGRYAYRAVQRPVLANLAYTSLSRNQSSIPLDDTLYDTLAQQLEGIHRRYQRRQAVMPEAWSAQDFLDDLLRLPVLTTDLAPEPLLRFSERSYRDYFAAVYLETAARQAPDAGFPVADLAPEQWMEPLIILLGLLPDGELLLNNLFASQPGLAADLWFEKQPYGVQAPASIKAYAASERAALNTSPLCTLNEPFSQRLIVRMLGSSRPRQRLEATGALTQRGLSALDALIDAAEDDHPLVSATATYALMHIGEPPRHGGPERPLPPLIAADDRSLAFQCYWGCNARVGPLHLMQVPRGLVAEILVTIEQTDFNPLLADADFEFWHTDPAWLAYAWFGARKAVDWVGLVNRCQWIAEQSVAVAQRAGERSALTPLAGEAWLRAARYDGLGRRLAADLGIPWEKLGLPDPPDWTEQDAEANHRRLRDLFGRTHRARHLALGHLTDESAFKVAQTAEYVDGSTIIGFMLGASDLRGTPEQSQAEATWYTQLEVAQSAERVVQSKIAGVILDGLRGASQSIPPRFIINGAMTLEQVVKSKIHGVEVLDCQNGGMGMLATWTATIEHFVDSRLTGIVTGSASEYRTPDA